MTARMLYLVRHARTAQNPEVPITQWVLDPAGIADLERLAGVVDWQSVRLFSSLEFKATETARLLSNGPVQQVAELGEVRRGGWSSDYHADVAAFFSRPEQPAAPGWETATAALARFDRAFRDLLQSTSGHVAVVSHGLVLTLWIAKYAAASPSGADLWRTLRFPDLFVAERDEIERALSLGEKAEIQQHPLTP